MKERLNKIRNSFSIKDLEDLSGIKSHTIRIWEKRYNLLQPERTETNLREYSVEQLQKLLNVSLLNRNGFKISKIAQLSKDEIAVNVLTLTSEESMNEKNINEIKIAILNFDLRHFNMIYDSLLRKNTFQDVFLNTFIPFLEYVGVLWQSNAFSPSHEHFISNLVRQKILFNIELESAKVFTPNVLFVPFLPLNEIHELGMLFVHYKILQLGYESVYLGQSVPINDLKLFPNRKESIIYVSSFTVAPTAEKALGYINELKKTADLKKHDQMWFSGNRVKHLTQENLPKSCYVFDSFRDLFSQIENMGKVATNS